MNTPHLITLLQDILAEVKLIRKHLDPPITPEERSAFMSALTEQSIDRNPKGKKATLIEVDGVPVTKQKGTNSNKK